MSETTEVKQYPLEASLWGTNTVYLACEHRQCRQNYAICANILKAHKEDRRKPEDYCSAEISKGICPALAMRAEEEAAGHALYYIPRVANPTPPPAERKDPLRVDTQSAGYQRAWGSAGNVIKGKGEQHSPRPAYTPSPVNTSPVNKTKPAAAGPADFGAVISQALKDVGAAKKVAEETRQPVITATQQPKPMEPPRKESVLERARRLAAERGGQHDG